MKLFGSFKTISLVLGSLFMGSCIHEYPSGSAYDPSGIETAIELDLDLQWSEKEITPEFSPTKARNDELIKVIAEVSSQGDIVGRDEFFVNSDEYAQGYVRHRLSFGLHALNYDLAVWCEYNLDEDIDPDIVFDSSSMNNIKIKSENVNSIKTQCGYAASSLDLRSYKGETEVRVIKQLNVEHSGARFRLITTDIRSFVEEELWAIENGETYTLTVNFDSSTPDAFDAYTGNAIRNYDTFSMTGALIPSYDYYGEKTIAEGFVFCDEEDEITMQVTVHNSARMIVVRSSQFSFKVKRGMTSIVYGDFLSEIFVNTIRVNNIWDGEDFIDL